MGPLGWQLQKFWKHQVLFAQKAPLVMGPTALHSIQQLHQAWAGGGWGAVAHRVKRPIVADLPMLAHHHPAALPMTTASPNPSHPSATLFP